MPCRRPPAAGSLPETVRQSGRSSSFSVRLVPISLPPWALGFVGTIYVAIAVISGAIFVGLAFRLHRSSDTDRHDASHLLVFSIFYLFLLSATLLADHRGDRSVDSRLVSRRETRRMVTFIRRHAYTPYQSRTQNHSRWITWPHCMRSCPSCLRACSAIGSSSSVRRKSASAPLLSPRRLRAMPRLK
jgi:hypothetical protein